MTVRFILDLRDEHAQNISLVGGKGAGLSMLLHHGFNVPGGFVLTVDAFDLAMKHAGLDTKTIGSMIASHPASYTDIRRTSARLRERTRECGIPDEVRTELRMKLEEFPETTFAIRSSALDEDSAGHSFAGMNVTVTNVATVEEVEQAIIECWMSVFGQRVLTYRALQRISSPVRIAVVVQEMVDSRRSGVMFTRDPSSSSKTSLIIESSFGQGEVVVGGLIEPDTYVVERPRDGARTATIASAHIGRKEFMITRDLTGGPLRTELDDEAAAEPSLSDSEVHELANIGIEIERAFDTAQDVEWCFDPAGELWIVQSRPITTRPVTPPPSPPTSPTSSPNAAAEAEPPAASLTSSGPPESSNRVVLGLAASPGIVTGPARIAESLNDARSLRLGEILIAEMTTPEWVSVIDRAAGVVTDRGGITSHAAIVSRELGVPAVVGTRTATTTFTDGQMITVDGSNGTVIASATTAASSTAMIGGVRAEAVRSTNDSITPDLIEIGRLRTRVMVNLAHARNAPAAAALPGVSGVGLLRAEFLLSEALGGVHPKKMVAEGRSDEFIEILTDSLEAIAKPFGDRRVVYRTADFRSNEFRHLDGGDEFEPIEENPMIGYRGCFRYVRDPELFRLELEAIDRVRRIAPGLTLMLPFVRTRWELEKCIEIIVDTIDPQGPRLPIWIMAEVPSVLYRMADYRRLGVSGVSIGSNDLTQLMLGVDRDSEICAELFDEQDDAVIAAIGDIIERASTEGMTTSLCGQAPSNNPEFARELVRLGIDSISVDPSAVSDVQKNLMLAEAGLDNQEKK